eukprot:7391902-Prymnesium_polylepis.3
MPSTLSKYEELRLEQIDENRQELIRLGIVKLVDDGDACPRKRQKLTSAPRPAPTPRTQPRLSMLPKKSYVAFFDEPRRSPAPLKCRVEYDADGREVRAH